MSFPSNYRWLRFGLLGFVALLLLIAALAYVMVDSRKVSAVAAAAVERATGRSLKVNGPVSLKLFPHLAVVAEDVTLGNVGWATDPEMVKADYAAFSVAWLPLLEQKISIDEVALRGVMLNLQAAPDSQKVDGNWDLSVVSDATTKDGNGIEGFDLHSVQLENVTIRFRNGAGSLTQSVVVDNLTGSVSETQVDFAGRMRWQQQPMDLKGRVRYETGVPLNVNLNVQADRLNLQSAESTESSKANTNADPRWVFDSKPLGLSVLPLLNGNMDIAVATLILPSGVTLPRLTASVVLDAASDGVLTVKQFSSGFGQGVINADGVIRGYTSSRPKFSFRGHAEKFTLEKVVTQSGSNQKTPPVQGGAGEFAFNVKATGASMRELVSGLSGEAQLSIGAAKVSTSLMNSSGDFVLSLLDTINPLRKSTDTTQIECAVAYLPVRNGMVNIAQSVGIETDRLNTVLDGQVNLKNEALNIKVYTSEKTGLTTGVNAAGLVQVNGTLRNPKLAINKTGVVKQAATVGLAVFTAGISLAAQNVVSVATKSSPCQNVLRPWSSIDGQVSAR